MVKIFSTKKIDNPFLNLPKIHFQSEDLIRINFLNHTKIPLKNPLIITSQNAIKSLKYNSLLNILNNRKIFCVGNQTKQRLKEKSFSQTIIMAPSAKKLANLIIEQSDTKKPLIYLCGNYHRSELLELENRGFSLKKITTYKTTLTPIKLSYKPDALLFFSPSAVESYLLQNEIGKEQCFCIGNTTAHTLKPYATNILISKKPSIKEVINLLNKWLLNYNLT